MPRRELVWTHGAIEQFAELLKRRKDVAGVRKCVEQHLLAAANDLENVAKKWGGPMEDLWLYRFRCDDLRDGKTIALLSDILQIVRRCEEVLQHLLAAANDLENVAKKCDCLAVSQIIATEAIKPKVLH